MQNPWYGVFQTEAKDSETMAKIDYNHHGERKNKQPTHTHTINQSSRDTVAFVGELERERHSFIQRKRRANEAILRGT